MDKHTIHSAFVTTIPVGMGYLVAGLAFGLMLVSHGFGAHWALIMSLFIYAGSGQYLAVSLLAAGASLGQMAVMTLLLNFRHLVYGLSMLEKFRGMGWRKWYMVFALTDEAYALLSAADEEKGHGFYYAVAMLCQCYWVAASVLGAVLGASLQMNSAGVEFAMTALFLVIAVGQWRALSNHTPALLGGGVTLLCLLAVGAQGMLLPALGLIVLGLSVLRPRLEQSGTREREVPL